MRVYHHLILLLCFSFQLTSQNTQLTWSPKLAKEIEQDHIANTDGRYFYHIRVVPANFGPERDVFVNKVRVSDMGLELTEQLVLKKGLRYHRMLMLKKTPIIQFYGQNQNKGIFTSYASILNNNGTISEPVILDIAEDRTFGYTNKPEVRLLPDSTKFIMIRYEPFKKKSDNVQIVYKIFDKELKSVSSGSFELINYDKEESITEITIDEEGNLFFIAPSKPEKKAKVKPFLFYKYNTVDGKLQVADFKLDHLVITPRIITVKDKVFFVGLIPDEEKKKSPCLYGDPIKGVFVCSFNKKDMTLIKRSEVDYTPLLKDEEGCNFGIRQVFVHNNSIKLVSDHQWHDYSAGAGYSHYYGPIVVSNLSFDGNISWSTVLPQDFISSTAESLGATAIFKTTKDLFFIYSSKQETDVVIPKDAIAELVKLDENGKVVKEFITSKDGYLKTGSYLQVNKTEIVILGNDQRLVKIGIKY